VEGESDAERKARQQRRWDNAVRISIFAIIGSGILTFAAQDDLFATRCFRVTPRVACVMNLRSIDGAKCTWALELKKQTNALPADSDLFGPALYLREKPQCPAGGIYSLRRIDQKPRCTIPGHTL
jgi:hypothetical protein